MSGPNYYGNDPQRHQGGFQRPHDDNSPGGAGLAGDYYNEAQGGQQQRPQHQGQQYGGQQQHPQGSQYGQQQYGQQHQGNERRDDYRRDDDRRDDDRRNDDRRDNNRRDDDIGGPDGERGVMGALAGAAAGGFGGAKFGGKATGHSKTSAVVGALAGAFAGHKIQDTAEDWKDDRDEEKKKKEDDEKRRKEEEKRRRRDDDDERPHRRRSSRRSSHRRPQESRARGGHYAGHFTSTSRDIDLDDRDDYNLRASCKRHDGSYQSSTIALNTVLENDNGSFRWASSGGHGGGDRPNTVTVQQGDTLRGIAARFGCSFEEIARHNGVNNPDLIYPGQVLQVPGGNHGHGGGRPGHFGNSARNVRLVDGGQKLTAELRRENGDWVKSSIVLDEKIKNDNGTLRLV
ncbi:CVNH domain-containing protein [Dactylonectria estremocensis]|uniref:CVNH domain-containing protein n=1 Tax=Dactylonectria estremocensis TaxID=1079267 RepID=A0A9P9J1G5_9HYPO|nr:CVNH domain-containing protein [Dactylonectria estremocensis]